MVDSITIMITLNRDGRRQAPARWGTPEERALARLLLLLLAASPFSAADEVPVYDLLAPAAHSFDIVYDVSTTRAGAAYFCNPIRPGSVASNERVVDRASGKPLPFEMVTGRAAKASGCVAAATAD